MEATFVNQAPLRLVTAKSNSFPDGNRAAFRSIESQLSTLRGRKFYGLAYESDGGLDYYAGLVPINEIEERRFAELGFPVVAIHGGSCARVKLSDWTSKTELIGPTFRVMIETHGIDHSRPQMEFYRSLRELHLLLPVPKMKLPSPCPRRAGR